MLPGSWELKFSAFQNGWILALSWENQYLPPQEAGQGATGQSPALQLVAGSLTWPEELSFLLVLQKTNELGRGTGAQIRQEVCARYSPVESTALGAALRLDAVPADPGEPPEEMKFPLRKEAQWTVIHRLWKPSLSTLHELDSFRHSGQFSLPGSGSCKGHFELVLSFLIKRNTVPSVQSLKKV